MWQLEKSYNKLMYIFHIIRNKNHMCESFSNFMRYLKKINYKACHHYSSSLHRKLRRLQLKRQCYFICARSILGYDMKSGEYSTWTESVWQAMWARMFVSAGGGGATAAAISGFVATLVAALFTYWLKTHSTIIFVKAPTATVANQDTTSG